MRAGFVAVLAAALSGVALWWVMRPVDSPPPPRMELVLGLPNDHRVHALTLSPDGRLMAYTTDAGGPSQIALRSLDTTKPVLLEGTTGAHHPFFSPDGRWLGFFADGKLRKIPTEGGTARDVCDAPVDSAGGAWRADHRIVFAPLDGRGLVTVDADGGKPEILTRLDTAQGEIAHGWPHVLPESGGLIFTIARRDKDSRIAVLGPDASAPRLLLPAHGPARYVSSGHLVYSFIGRLFALAFDVSTLESQGGPIPIADDVQASPRGFDALGQAVFDASRGGVVAYLPGSEEAPTNELVWVARDGSAEGLSSPTGVHETPRVSPTGTHVAVVVRNGPFSRDVWVHELSSGRRTKLTNEGSQNHSPVWAPHGRELAWASNRYRPAEHLCSAAGCQSRGTAPARRAGHAQSGLVESYGNTGFLRSLWFRRTRYLAPPPRWSHATSRGHVRQRARARAVTRRSMAGVHVGFIRNRRDLHPIRRWRPVISRLAEWRD